MKKQLLSVSLLMMLTLLSISTIAQSYTVQRGHAADDLYIYCRKNAVSNSVMQFYHLWNHGQNISVQYTIPYPATNNDLNLKNFVADPKPGVLFCTSLTNTDTSMYKSTDYGKTWQHMSLVIHGLTPPIALMGGSVSGEIILNERRYAQQYDIGSTTDFFATHTVNASYNSYFTKPEAGISSGEIYGINNAYGSNRDYLLHSANFGVTIDTVAIDSAVVYNANGNLAQKVCHGSLPGEIFLITLEAEQSGFPHVYSIYHSTDYGHNYLLQNVMKFDESSTNTDFTGGRDACSFYVVNWKFDQLLQRQIMQVYYSADCGKTFTLYSYDLNATVSLEELSLKDTYSVVLFPSPGHDFLNLHSNPQINGAQFTLYTMQGQSVLTEVINSTQLRIHTTQLTAGTYPWQIVFKNKVIESGKWVKE